MLPATLIGLRVRPMASLYALVKSSLACRAMGSAVYNRPRITPGGNPVIALPGESPTLPTTLVGPVFVTVEPARIAKGAALRRSTNAVAGRIGNAEPPRGADLPNAGPSRGAAGVEVPEPHAATKAVTRPARSIGFSCCFSIKKLQQFPRPRLYHRQAPVDRECRYGLSAAKGSSALMRTDVFRRKGAI